MDQRMSLTIYERVVSVLLAFVCMFPTVMTLLVWQLFLDCMRWGRLGIDPKCPSPLTAWMLVGHPFFLLLLIFLISITISAVVARSIVAKRVLQWWGVLFTLFLLYLALT